MTHGSIGLWTEASPADGRERPTSPTLVNLTLLGASGSKLASTTGALFETHAEGAIYRSVFTNDGVNNQESKNGRIEVDGSSPVDLRRIDSVFRCTPYWLAACDDGP